MPGYSKINVTEAISSSAWLVNCCKKELLCAPEVRGEVIVCAFGVRGAATVQRDSTSGFRRAHEIRPQGVRRRLACTRTILNAKSSNGHLGLIACAARTSPYSHPADFPCSWILRRCACCEYLQTFYFFVVCAGRPANACACRRKRNKTKRRVWFHHGNPRADRELVIIIL